MAGFLGVTDVPSDLGAGLHRRIQFVKIHIRCILMLCAVSLYTRYTSIKSSRSK